MVDPAMLQIPVFAPVNAGCRLQELICMLEVIHELINQVVVGELLERFRLQPEVRDDVLMDSRYVL